MLQSDKITTPTQAVEAVNNTIKVLEVMIHQGVDRVKQLKEELQKAEIMLEADREQQKECVQWLEQLQYTKVVPA
jgi:flagellar biosynthesis chaperone FliJ